MNLIESENLFIDTSVFVKENFLEGGRIKNILELARQGYFKLYFSPITVNEIKARYKKAVKIAYAKHNEVINDKHGDLRVLKNHPRSADILQRFPNERDICAQFNEKFDQALQQAQAQLLDYPTISIEKIFTDYFNNTAPFNKSDKKHEFPDAFALAHISQWTQATGEKVVVFSTDRDFASKNQANIQVIPAYDKYLEKLMKKIDPKRIEILKQLIDQKTEAIKEQIIDAVKEDLYQESTYDDLTNWLEVHNINIKHTKFLMWGFDIVTLHTETIEVEYFADIAYKVVIEIDDEESGIYDSEDRRMIYRDVKKITVKDDDLRYSLLLSFDIIDEDDYDDDYKILQYNNGKAVEISSENW